jgi:oligosaccharide repeat unit polymerase
MTGINSSDNNLPTKRNTRAATFVICIGCVVTGMVLPTDDPNATFRTAAFFLGPVLGIALGLEARSGLRALLRTDTLMLVVLYGLTLLEFLFPQPNLSHVVSPEPATSGTQAVLWAFACIALGRHILPSRRTGGWEFKGRRLSPSTLFTLFFLSFTLGYLHIFLAVNFDVPEALRQMTYPRFYQDWSRGRLGDWTSLLTELGLLIYLLPPIAGAVFARREEYKAVQKLFVLVILALTFFYGFSGGTRSAFITYLLTFATSYLLFKRDLKTRQIVAYGGVVIVLTSIATVLMLEFRTVGLANYTLADSTAETLFVDDNIVTISRLIDVFPDRVAYLGLEIPLNALIRPIPRAIWPEKPEGLSVGIEDALGAEGLTLAATFVGESYMSYGLLGVIITSVLLGVLAGWWNRMGHDADSDFKLLLYVSGFFAAALAMRSILQVVPAVLPTLALWTYGKFYLQKRPRSRGTPVAGLAGRVSQGASHGAGPGPGYPESARWR